MQTGCQFVNFPPEKKFFFFSAFFPSAFFSGEKKKRGLSRGQISQKHFQGFLLPLICVKREAKASSVSLLLIVAGSKKETTKICLESDSPFFSQDCGKKMSRDSKKMREKKTFFKSPTVKNVIEKPSSVGGIISSEVDGC